MPYSILNNTHNHGFPSISENAMPYPRKPLSGSQTSRKNMEKHPVSDPLIAWFALHGVPMPSGPSRSDSTQFNTWRGPRVPSTGTDKVHRLCISGAMGVLWLADTFAWCNPDDSTLVRAYKIISDGWQINWPSLSMTHHWPSLTMTIINECSMVSQPYKVMTTDHH